MTQERKTAVKSALCRWGAFLGVAIGALFVVLLPFIVRGNYLAWGGSGGGSDGISQHATFLQYMFGKNMYGGVGGYDYKIGLGADYLTSFAYYMLFDPVNLLLYILPRSNFLLAYSLLTVVRFLLTAVCMYVYLRYRKVRQTYSVLFAVAYMLSGYMLFSFVRHPDLTAGAMYLPLVVLGLEQAVDKKRPYVLVVFVFLITVSSFYMAYMVTLYAIAYAALYYCLGVKKRGEKITGKAFCATFFRVALYYALGLLAASFVLLPMAYAYLHGARTGGKGLSLYDPYALVQTALSFFASVKGGDYGCVMFNIVTLALAFAAIASVRGSAHRILAVALSVGVFVPTVGQIMNLFNYASNRFVYMLSFSVFAMLPLYLQERADGVWSPQETNGMARGVCASCIALANFGVWAAVKFLFGKGVAAGALGVVAAVLVFFASLWALRKLWHIDTSRLGFWRAVTCRRLLYAFASVTLASAVVFCCVYSAQFDDGTRFAAYRSAAEQTVARTNDEFVRLDTHLSVYPEMTNRSLNNGYYGTTMYNSMFSKSASQFVLYNNVYTLSTTLGMSGLNGRRALQALLGVKYMKAATGEYVPHGFVSTATPELYETDNFIPFGTVFSQTMAQSEWLELPEAERQYALLEAVVLQRGSVETEYSRLLQETDIQIADFALEKGKAIQVTLPVVPGCERYIAFSLKKLPREESKFTVKVGALSFDMRVAPKGNQMYKGQKHFLYKTDENADTLTFTHVYGLPLSFYDVKVYTVPYRDIERRIALAASQPHLTDVAFSDRRIEGKIVSDGGAMLFPIAHSGGWRARVDGKSTPVYSADGGLTAISVPAGEHAVTLDYSTPWLKGGYVLSCLALGGVAALFVFSILRQMRKKAK